jgi:hypothetical protein
VIEKAYKSSETGQAQTSGFASITREDGKKQTTYKGMPLYYFARDAAPGDTKADVVKEIWLLAKPRGTVEERRLISGPATGPSRLLIST